MGEAKNDALEVGFDPKLRLEFIKESIQRTIEGGEVGNPGK